MESERYQKLLDKWRKAAAIAERSSSNGEVTSARLQMVRIQNELGMTEDDIDFSDPLIREMELASYQIYYEQKWIDLQRVISIPYSEITDDFKDILLFDPVAVEWKSR